MKNIVRLIASFFYLGYLPLASGTLASAAALGLYFLLRNNFGLYSAWLIVITAVGFLVCGPAERIFQQKDSSRIVIDEVAGLLLAFWGLKPDFTFIIIGFFIFRALDAVKAYPANIIERSYGALGVMGDDLLAGLYTNVVLRLAVLTQRLFSCF